MKQQSLLFLIFLIFLAKADIPADLVTELDEQTGYTKPWYSGYLDISQQGEQMKVHYVFYPSQNKPESDPVLLWLNGGPGCSSHIGLAQENGPWGFGINQTDIELNPYSWNNNASVLYLESPPGVGFSTTTDYQWDDYKTAEINLKTLLEFFKGFSEYKDLDFYLSGESYAGVYIPTLANEILKYNEQAEQSQQILLKGFLVGNGCTDPFECNLNTTVDPFMYQAYSAQGFFTPDQEEAYQKFCGSYKNPDQEKLNSLECTVEYYTQLANCQTNVDTYQLIGTCYHQYIADSKNLGQNRWSREIRRKVRNMLRNEPHLLENSSLSPLEMRKLLESSNEDDELPPCDDSKGMLLFFNQLEVKKALHVDLDINWEVCSAQISIFYTRFSKGSYYLYPDLIKKGLKIWIYSGDTDGAVPTSGSLYWVEKLVKEQKYETTEQWRSWYTEGAQFGLQPGNRQNAGQFWQTDGITFVTFKACGHQVPTYNPIGSYDMITAFLNDEVLAPY